MIAEAPSKLVSASADFDFPTLSKPIGVAIVGAGGSGSKLVAEYLAAQRRGKVKLLKICDSSIAALGALLIDKETSSITQEMLTQDIHDLLDSPDIEIVHVATHMQTHYELAKMALESGKNVLIEKPMTPSSHESYHLIDVAKEGGFLVEVSRAITFNRALQIASEMLNGGEMGKLSNVKIRWTDTTSSPDGDIIFNLGQDPLDILNLLLHAWPESVTGVGRVYRNSGTHNDMAYISTEYRDNTFAQIELSLLHTHKIREVTIVASGGSLIIDCLRQLIAQHSANTTFQIPVTPSNGILAQIEHFADRVARRDRAIDLTGPRILETLEAISRSVSEKKLTAVANVKYEEEIVQLAQDPNRSISEHLSDENKSR